MFADRANLLAVVSKYLFNDEARRAVERRALQFALDMQRDLQPLEDALLASLRQAYAFVEEEGSAG